MAEILHQLMPGLPAVGNLSARVSTGRSWEKHVGNQTTGEELRKDARSGSALQKVGRVGSGTSEKEIA